MIVLRRFVPILFLFGLLATACPADEPSQPRTTPEPTEVSPGEDGDSSPAAGTEFEFDLTGAAEEPGPGDPDGTGNAKITVDESNSQVCFELQVSAIGKPDAAHIHKGAAGVAGPIVVTLITPAGTAAPFQSKGCEGADKALLEEIKSQPQNFYVNIHNPEFKSGAVRGQLKV